MVDHEGEVLESVITKTRDRKATLKLLKKSMKLHSRPAVIVTDILRPYCAALKSLACDDDHEIRYWFRNRIENANLPLPR